MNNLLRYGVYAIAGTGGLLLAGVLFVAVTFDPNDYKAELIQRVKDSKQRTLVLDGDIKLTLFPKVGVSLGKMSLSESGGTQLFAAVDDVRAALAFWPMLRGEAVVDTVSITGLKATLVRRKDGTTNIDDLLSKDEGASTPDGKVNFDIAGVNIARTELAYRDESSGAQYALRDLELTIGRLAPGVQTTLDLAARVQAKPSASDVQLRVKTGLMLDPESRHYTLDGLAASMGGMQASNKVELVMTAAQIALDGDKLNADKLHLMAKLAGANALAATLAVPSLAGTTRSFASEALTLSVEANGDTLPNKRVSSEMRGRFAFDSDKQNLDVSLAGGLLQSRANIKLAVNNFDAPSIRFNAELDQFDVDQYFPLAPPTQSDAPEQPFDLSALKALNLEGKLRIGALTVAKIKSRDINLAVKARNGVIQAAPFSAKLYDGSLVGSVTVNAAQPIPGFAVSQTLSGVDVSALTRDAADFDMLEGHGNVGLNITAHGNTVNGLKKSLNGSLSLNLADGAIKGINVAKTLREFGGKLGKSRTQDANQDEKTDFSELKASFNIASGVAHNDDLTMKSPLLRLSGNGDIDMGNDRMNYLAKATLVKTLEGQGGQDNLAGLTVPVRVQGPFDDLKYSLDFGAAVTESAKQKVEEKKQELKTRLQDQLKGLLRH